MGIDSVTKVKMIGRKFRITTFQVCIIFLCLGASFLNYCIVQIVPPYILPLTTIPIVATSLFSHHTPTNIIAVVSGILDDTMLNAPLGTFPLAYIILMYILRHWNQNTIVKRIIFFVFLIIFIVINIIDLFRIS